MGIELVYRWRYFDAARGKHFTTRYLCTEEQIRLLDHPDAEAVSDSLEVRGIPEKDDDQTGRSLAHLQGPPREESACAFNPARSTKPASSRG
jgi:hypothetical protein